VETPVKLSRKQKELLEQFDSTLGKESKRHTPRSSSWLDSVRTFFDRMT